MSPWDAASGEKNYPETKGMKHMKERFGVNPARFLSPEIDTDPLPIIRGIADPGLLSAYEGVERKYWNRSRILKAIEARRSYLEANPEVVRTKDHRKDGVTTGTSSEYGSRDDSGSDDTESESPAQQSTTAD